MAPDSPGQQVGGGAGLGAAGVAVARGSDRFPDGAGLASAAANPLAGVEPVGVLGVLDGGFDLLRRGLALFVALAAALLLPLQLVDLLAQLNAGLDTQLATSGSPLESLSLLGSIDDRPAVETLLDYSSMRRLNDDWQEAFARADPDVVLWYSELPLSDELDARSDWETVLTTDDYQLLCHARIASRCL